ncbi:MAG: hypothetical protein K2M68_06520 [Muribaculaceae bacterium]|nr:hypothetical protein [Muribaculaceae bacterium]
MNFNFVFSIQTIILSGTLLLLTLYIVTLVRKRVACPAKCSARPNVGTPDNAGKPVTIVVYARDNSTRLEALLGDLLTQTYPAPYEIIVVNDSGGYECSDVVTRLSLKHANLRMTFVPEQAHNLSRKKLAITLGLKAARYPYVLLLNAECRLGSSGWLEAMSRDTDKVTLGNAVITPDVDTQSLSPLMTLDAANTAITWIAAAEMHRPYRGTGYNIGYPTATFFAKDGFAGTLNLKAGDDDLFVNKITTPVNTRVELSAESQVDITTSHARRLYRELKISHNFTGRSLPCHPVMDTLPLVLWLSIAIGIAATWLAWPNLTVAAGTLLLLLAQWIILARTWHKSSVTLRYPTGSFSVIPILLILPLHNLRYRLAARSNKSQHYTWQKQKKV